MTVIGRTSVALATLATNTAILIGGPTMTRGGRCLSVRGGIGIHTITPGDGPWIFGLVNGDFSLAELEEYLELNGPVTPNDTTAVERASRGAKVRTLGILRPSGDGSVAAEYLADRSLSGFRFSESGEGPGWNWWLYNLGKAMSTGAIWNIQPQIFTQFNPSG